MKRDNDKLLTFNNVRAGFIIQGTSLSKWCHDNNVCRVWATDALKYKRNGIKATQLRQRLIKEAGCVHE